MTAPVCCFCGGTSLTCVGRGLFHPLKRDHGPFDFYRCATCGSGTTPEPPTPKQLADLYGSFREGLPELHRTLTADDPQISWYRQCVNRASALMGKPSPSAFRWIDVGAGGGELSAMMSDRFPQSRGIAIDLHPRPASLRDLDRVDWRQSDLNGDFSADLPPADLVISTAVWEHVLRPDRFASELLKLTSDAGMIYLLCPNYDSLARRVMGSRWPYFTPGEHLHLPTPEGARRCLEREARQRDSIIVSRPILLPYSLRYVLRRFGLERLGRLVPMAVRFPMPVGALETTVRIARRGTAS